MRRFMMNRWWTIVLACVLGMAGLLTSPASVRADGKLSAPGSGGDNPTDSGVGGNPAGVGDPDIPTRSGKVYGRGAMGQAGTFDAPAARIGQRSPETLLWTMKFQVAMRMLRAYYLRD
jgi:hypothetical protein